MEAAGYRPYIPPRANWGPGFVFTGTIRDGKISDVEEVCSNIYGQKIRAKSNSVLLPAYKEDNRVAISGLIEILKGALRSRSINAGAAFDQGKTTEIRVSDAKEYSYTDEDKWIKEGVARPIAPRCLAAINDLKLKGKFDGRTFIIARAVAAEKFVYDVKDRGLALKLEGSLANVADIKVLASGNASGETHIEFGHSMFIGYAPPYLITEWVPTGRVSASEIVKVKGEALDLVVE
ncbi:hypothetical protein [Methylobacterium radiotolerans]